MQLTVRDVARLMNVGENMVRRWVTEEQLPAEEVNGQYRLNKVELLEWATVHKREVPVELFQAGNGNGRIPRLDDALNRGGVHDHVPGPDKETALAHVVNLLPLDRDYDRQFLLSLYLSRESLGSTGVGDGLAVPHPRYPVVLPVDRPAAALCYLERPIPYASPDGKPVHTLFVLISPTVRSHNQLLARLACALKDADFRRAVLGRAPAAEVLRQARRVEDTLRSQTPPEGV
jgi:PTS system nitrogen regulatory IIA component